MECAGKTLPTIAPTRRTGSGWRPAQYPVILGMVVLCIVLQGCGPDSPDVVAEIPPRQSVSGPYEVQEYSYQKEAPVIVDSEEGSCAGLVRDVRRAFPAVYRERMPRVAFVVNVVDQENGPDSLQSDEHREIHSRSQVRQAEHVDEASVANQYIAFFQDLTSDMIIVDVPTAQRKTQFESIAEESEKDASRFVAALRERDVCDLIIMIELRVRRGLVVEQTADGMIIEHSTGASATGRAVHGTVLWGEAGAMAVGGSAASRSSMQHGSASLRTTSTEGGVISAACTARAVWVDNGQVAAVTTPDRFYAADEAVLGDLLSTMCVCSAADLADRLVGALGRDAIMPLVTVRITGREADKTVSRVGAWIDDAYPGSRVVKRIHTRDHGELTVRLNGAFEELVADIGRERAIDGISLDAVRSGSRTLWLRNIGDSTP